MKAAVLALAVLAGCISEPSYVDRTCTAVEPCPRGYVCGLDGVCHAREGFVPPPPDAGPACDPADPALQRAPEDGWVVSYHPLAPDGTIDHTRCFGIEQLSGELPSFTASTSTAALGVPAAAVLRGRRRFGGMEVFTLSHAGGLRIRAGGAAIYDTFRHGAREATTIREYVHGVQSVVLELALEGARPFAEVVWATECERVEEPGPMSWRARYYRAGGAPDYALDRGDCLGAELLPRVLSYVWNDNAPAIVLALGITDRFGADYDARRTFAADTTADLYADDGIRIYAADALLFESWVGSQTLRTTVVIPAGEQALRVEWFENIGFAGVGLVW